MQVHWHIPIFLCLQISLQVNSQMQHGGCARRIGHPVRARSAWDVTNVAALSCRSAPCMWPVVNRPLSGAPGGPHASPPRRVRKKVRGDAHGSASRSLWPGRRYEVTLTAAARRVVSHPTVNGPDVMTVWFERQNRTAGHPVPAQDARRVPQMRRLVAARLRLCGLPELVEPMELLTSELITNALEHGDGPGVSLLLSCSRETVRLTVDDGSRESPQLAAPELDAESGRGLWIVAAIASEYGGSWGVSSDCTKTWCSLTVPAVMEPAV
ncbi:ATP-binding protein [Streptomyces sp. NBC_01483]|uniref:ATP-binding protein n=2 Tax=Streptomyces sp. NBC_01483 TaxID=2903883 RepID=UPI002E302DF2|nr:ATP-binding protein [Streptomyces sp. NBC_01483]